MMFICFKSISSWSEHEKLPRGNLPIPCEKILRSCSLLSGTNTGLHDKVNNSRGTDEIGYCPSWFTSNWGRYYVYTLRKNHWVEAINPITIYYHDYWGGDMQPVVKHKTRKGYVIVNESDVGEVNGAVNNVIKTRTVKLK